MRREIGRSVSARCRQVGTRRRREMQMQMRMAALTTHSGSRSRLTTYLGSRLIFRTNRRVRVKGWQLGSRPVIMHKGHHQIEQCDSGLGGSRWGRETMTYSLHDSLAFSCLFRQFGSSSGAFQQPQRFEWRRPRAERPCGACSYGVALHMCQDQGRTCTPTSRP